MTVSLGQSKLPSQSAPGSLADIAPRSPMGSVIVHLRHLFDKGGVWQHYDELLETPKGGKATTGGRLSYSAGERN